MPRVVYHAVYAVYLLLYAAFSSEEETAPKLNKRRFVTHGISIISSLTFYSEGEDL